MSNLIGYCQNCNGIWLSNEQNDAEHLSDTDHGTHRACTEDTVGRTTLGFPLKVHANFYRLGSTYGGPEEGGWNKTTHEPIASLLVEATIEEKWEDVGGPESGPRLVMQGYQLGVTDASQKLIAAAMGFYYKHPTDKKFIDFVLEFGWPRYSEHPPYYS